MEDVSALIRQIQKNCEARLASATGEPADLLPELTEYYELTRGFYEVAVKEFCGSSQPPNKPETWAKPIAEKLTLASEEKDKLHGYLVGIQKLLTIRNDVVHKQGSWQKIKKLIQDTRIDRKIEAVLKVFADRNHESRIIPELFRRMPKRVAEVIWIRFWRLILETSEVQMQGKVERILEELKNISPVRTLFSMNPNIPLTEIAVKLIHRLDSEIEKSVCEIFENSTIRANLPAGFAEIHDSEKYRIIQESYQAKPKRYLLQATVSESGNSTSPFILELVERAPDQREDKIGNTEGTPSDLITFCLNEIAERRGKYRSGNTVFQWVGAPEVVRQFYSREKLIQLLRSVSVVAVAPRKAKRLESWQLERLKKAQCTGVNENNRFEEQKPAANDLISKSIDEIDELWAGWNTSLVEMDWNENTEPLTCEFLDSFEENAFFFVVLCSAEQPEDDWKSISDGKDQVSVEEFLELFSEHQRKGIRSPEERMPRLLYQDAQFEKRHRARPL